MAQLLTAADRLGIERVCISMGMTFVTRPTPDELKCQNDEVLQALSHYHDRAFGFCYASGEHPEASLDEIERCVAAGPMVGVKLWVARRCNDEALDAIVARATELRALILQHTWFKTDGSQLPGESTPADLAALAKRHPEQRFVCGHSGGTWAMGIRAVRETANVVIETAGFDPTNGYLQMALRELGPARVAFGSDAPGRSFASQLAKVTDTGVSAATQQLILHDNLRSWLGPILAAKGVNAS
jgi:predicted TIM-barrel fold metal-dependent hydrolase